MLSARVCVESLIVLEMMGAFFDLSRFLGCLGAVSRRVGSGAHLSGLSLPLASSNMRALVQKLTEGGPPWWLSGKGSTYQCRRRRFHP